MTETGSDAQMSVEQATEVRGQYELDRAEEMEEERKTAAQPIQDDPAAVEEGDDESA